MERVLGVSQTTSAVGGGGLGEEWYMSVHVILPGPLFFLPVTCAFTVIQHFRPVMKLG